MASQGRAPHPPTEPLPPPPPPQSASRSKLGPSRSPPPGARARHLCWPPSTISQSPLYHPPVPSSALQANPISPDSAEGGQQGGREAGRPATVAAGNGQWWPRAPVDGTGGSARLDPAVTSVARPAHRLGTPCVADPGGRWRR